jgi:hypothetical protein
MLRICLCSFGLLATTAWAQTTVDLTPQPPQAGAYEFTLGGGGGADTDLDDSFGGVNFSVGKYLSDTLAVVLRQSVNYANPDAGGNVWNGSTFIALDQHFGTNERLRPFVGVNFGRIYGDNVADSWAAGLEAGAKYYVHTRTFVYALAQYAWLFEEGNDIDDTFSDGQLLWTVGIGFNF